MKLVQMFKGSPVEAKTFDLNFLYNLSIMSKDVLA